MSKITRNRLRASIVEKTGVKARDAKAALETVLESIKTALKEGKRVDLGLIGQMSVTVRVPRSRINKNLRHVGPNIDRLYKEYPKTVTLAKRHDLSPNPQPTIVTKTIVLRTAQVAIAVPTWRPKPKYKERSK